MGGKFQKKKNKRPLLLGSALVLAAALTVTGALAAYRSEMQYQAEMIAADFHISSNYLEETEKKAEYSVSDWADGIEIQLYNYEKENIALVAAEDIVYEVAVDNNDFQIEETERTLSKGDKTAPDLGRETQILTLVPKNDSVEPDTVEVTVTTKTPFKKVLSATFKLSGTQLPVMTQTTETTHQLVTITTGQYEGNITLTWPSTLAPDNTNTLMADWTNADSGYSSGIIEAQPFTTYELIFFGSGTVTMTYPTSGN